MDIAEMDEDQAKEKLLELMREAKGCDQSALAALKEHLISISNYVNALKEEEEFVEFLDDINPDEFAEILNNANFRSGVGLNPSKCPELFELILTYFCPIDENVEVVLAHNPHIPDSVIAVLEKSNFSWEQDGTTQSLARNTNNSELLRRLSKSTESSTRFEVAANPMTPVDVLCELVADSEYSDSLMYWGDGCEALIQYAVVLNPSTPNHILEEVISGKHRISSDFFEENHANEYVCTKAQEILKKRG